LSQAERNQSCHFESWEKKLTLGMVPYHTFQWGGMRQMGYE
jgi:hypothetical protein